MTTMTSRRVPVRLTDSPREDRYVSLTTTRLLSTDLYVVGVVDSSGRLAEPTSLRVTPNLDVARTHANALVEKWGGVVEPDHEQWLPKKRRRRGRRILSVERVCRRPDGRYIVRWQDARLLQMSGKSFDTEAEAQSYHEQLTQRMENER
jgi:hypothetical protein